MKDTLEDSMSQKRIHLPDRETMMARLRKVDDNPHYQQHFYPLLLEHAGTPKIAHGAAMILTLALYDYAEGLGVSPELLKNQMDAGRFIDALIEDEEVAAAAKTIFQ